MKSTTKSNTRTKTAAPASRAARPVASKPPTPMKREIATRAYELDANSGHQPGREVEFWLEAERQLKRGLKK